MESNEELSASEAQLQGLVLIQDMATISVIREVVIGLNGRDR
jgi:hypothetical protein